LFPQAFESIVEAKVGRLRVGRLRVGRLVGVEGKQVQPEVIPPIGKRFTAAA